jgi:hypothetical protein
MGQRKGTKTDFVEYCIGVESAFREELYFSQLYYKRSFFEAMFIQNKPKLTTDTTPVIMTLSVGVEILLQ